MKVNPECFIEVIKCEDGNTKCLLPAQMWLLNWALKSSLKFGIETIAVFKIYPKEHD